MISLMDCKNVVILCGVGMMIQIYVDCVENVEIWDKDGQCYIDFVVGIVVVNIGYCYFWVIQVVKDQLDCFIYICYQVVFYENYVVLVEWLNDLVLGDGLKKIVFYIIGVEVVENVVKIVWYYKNCFGIIVFLGGFYGCIFMGMLLIGKVQFYKVGFGLMMNDIWYLFFLNELYGVSQDQVLVVLDWLFKFDIDLVWVVVIIVEFVQGEGGFYEVLFGFLQCLCEICD